MGRWEAKHIRMACVGSVGLKSDDLRSHFHEFKLALPCFSFLMEELSTLTPRSGVTSAEALLGYDIIIKLEILITQTCVFQTKTRHENVYIEHITNHNFGLFIFNCTIGYHYKMKDIFVSFIVKLEQKMKLK
jgi:hypothetical protein